MYYGDEVGEEVNDVESGIFYELKSLEQDIFRTFFNLDEVDKKKMPAPTQMRISRIVAMSFCEPRSCS